MKQKLLSILILFCPSLIHAFVSSGSLLKFPIKHQRAQSKQPTQLHSEAITSSTQEKSTAIVNVPNKPPYIHYNSTLAPSTPKLKQYQSQYAPITSSFEPGTFNPLPLFSNRHVQTIGGVFLRTNCAYFRNVPSMLNGLINSALDLQNNEYITPTSSDDWYYDQRERIITPSGGAFFSVDHKDTPSKSRGTVIIVHGLESNSNSTLCIDMSNAYIQRGYDVSVINFRGCCGTDAAALYADGTLIRNNENTLMYHLGFVDDLIYYLSVLASRGKKQPIFLSGFSLGANVILKALGQMGSDAVDKYGIMGAAVAGAPFDTERNYMQFHQDPISRLVYVNNLLNKLKSRAEEILNVMYGGDVDAAGFDYWMSMNASTIYELESACVAPLFGFEDHIDYYRKTSCGYFLERICVPTYIVNARDDPFFDGEYVPWDKICGEENGSCGGGPPVKIVATDGGGHLGYIFHQLDDHRRDDGSCKEVEGKSSSWISEELARFVEHAHGEALYLEESTSVLNASSLPLI